MIPVLHSLVGLLLLTVLAWLLSENRRAASWRLAAAGVALQLAIALPLFKVPAVQGVFARLNDLVLALQKATDAGTSFVFGYLGGAPLPFQESAPGASFILAFKALPLVLVISALSALLFHWRVLPWIVRGVSLLLEKSLGIGGALGVSAGANIFVGMVESPLLIRPYLRNLSRGELFAVMTCGMATIAGTMMVLYASILGRVLPDALGHILVASILSAPAAITTALLMVPHQGAVTTGEVLPDSPAQGAMDAVARGTADGVNLLIQIIAMLVVLVALVSLANQILGLLPMLDGAPVTLQRLLGWLMAPVVWIMGIPWQEAHSAGALMGTKTILNEFIAYLDLANLPAEALSPRSRLMMTYALCGFANFGSLGIMIGGMGSMVPERRQEIVALGPRSIVAGTLATCMTGAVAGIFF